MYLSLSATQVKEQRPWSEMDNNRVEGTETSANAPAFREQLKTSVWGNCRRSQQRHQDCGKEHDAKEILH